MSVQDAGGQDNTAPANEGQQPSQEQAAQVDIEKSLLGEKPSNSEANKADDEATQSAKPEGEGEKDQAEEGQQSEDGDGLDAPDEYAEFTMPEGIEVDAELLDEATPLLKELGLSQEQAQKVIDFYANNIVVRTAEAQQSAWADTLSGWKDTIFNSKEFGGDALEENLAHAKKFLDAYGGPEILQTLEQTGMGVNPSFVFMLMKAGRDMVGEDKFRHEGAQVPEKKTAAQKLYSSSN